MKKNLDLLTWTEAQETFFVWEMTVTQILPSPLHSTLISFNSGLKSVYFAMKPPNFLSLLVCRNSILSSVMSMPHYSKYIGTKQKDLWTSQVH